MTKTRQRLPGHIRREEIIGAALKVMAKQGYQKFTMRNVAEHAGIHFATLQYYFKNKNELLRALLDFKLEEDSRIFHAAISNGTSPVKERFTAALNVILKANRQPVVIGYFLQIWALSHHDKAAARNLGRYYDAYLNWIKELVTLAKSDHTEEELEARARIILALLEGLVPTFTRSVKNRKPDKTFDRHIIETAWRISSD